MIEPTEYPAMPPFSAQPYVVDAAPSLGGDVNEPTSTENTLLAAAVELQSQLDRADTLADAAHSLVHQLAQILDSPHVTVCWRETPALGMRCIATTADMVDPTQVAAAEELALRGRTAHWPPESSFGDTDRGGMLAIAQYARESGATKFAGSCLCDDVGSVAGVVMVLDAKQASSDHFLDALSVPLASKLIAIRRHQGGRLQKVVASLVNSSPSPLRAMAIAAAATTLLMFAPATYTVDAKLELQPVRRRFVAAAFDGPLQACHVRPGDVVAEGDLLAEIDPREIQYELAGIESQLEQAMQTRKGHVAQHEFGAGRIAYLESERLRAKTELLAHRRDHLEIRSPIEGMIVSGDWRSREGTPLSRGETLFEIAPLTEMVVEIWVPESEITHVRAGMPVRFYTNAAPEKPMIGQVSTVHPKAELQDHDNVFIAEVHVNNDAGWLQPGMRGRATIYSDTHPIGWNLFHRPWFALRNWIGI
ncbi:efflux RND transporter periplasmic adaptor subunit [Aporhodopirellula aestuarii]|uniref:HlyD family efflux transporter periplasmic adaptor subunit n=1 Tax=Aporhodopirellula aestuarii TaxID=2950107 RepID=A0ABT0U7B3_9BACT|nr:HlyD family efflux transporter periplasmic adaptor subunit [Aporhodopirellula aestuarii]MCM2372829.1 HlyD family efflux transporter periplasmic adaptor subunit [Aporhodopirellula aestuarii]